MDGRNSDGWTGNVWTGSIVADKQMQEPLLIGI